MRGANPPSDGGLAHAPAPGPGGYQRAHGAARRRDRAHGHLHRLPGVPAAPAADVDLHRRLPRRRPLGTGRVPPAVHAPRPRDRVRLRRADPGPGRDRGDADPADRRAGQQPDPQPARLRAGHPGLRPAQRPPAPAGGGLQHHRGAAEAGEQPDRPGGRRRGDPVRHRARAGELDLRRRVDPDPEPVHDRVRALVAGVGRAPPGRGARGVAQPAVRPDRHRRRQLRRRRAAAGARRRPALVRRADDPGRPVRGLARGADLRARPDPAGRRHPRRDHRRDHHAVPGLPHGRRSSGSPGRSSTSSSRTA